MKSITNLDLEELGELKVTQPNPHHNFPALNNNFFTLINCRVQIQGREIRRKICQTQRGCSKRERGIQGSSLPKERLPNSGTRWSKCTNHSKVYLAAVNFVIHRHSHLKFKWQKSSLVGKVMTYSTKRLGFNGQIKAVTIFHKGQSLKFKIWRQSQQQCLSLGENCWHSG